MVFTPLIPNYTYSVMSFSTRITCTPFLFFTIPIIEKIVRM